MRRIFYVKEIEKQVKLVGFPCIMEQMQIWLQERQEGHLMLISIKQLLVSRLKN